MRIFEPALRQLTPGTWSVSEPISFQKYLRDHGLPKKDTAPLISVDSLDRLSPELQEAGAMVLRLGRATNGPGTQFVLVSTPERLEDFFLIDREIFTQTTPEVFEPDWNPRELLPYHLLPKLTEGCIVNLAFASGLMGYALGLDEPWPVAAPATGSGTYDFHFRPLPGVKLLHHRNGQVEIDAIFTGRRGGRDLVFVIESKMGPPGSLAKHKLTYPLWSLAPRLNTSAVVPVYLRCAKVGKNVVYDIAECRGVPLHLTGLHVTKHKRIALPLPTSDDLWGGYPV